MGYDAYLEAPFQRMCEEVEAFMAYCDEYEFDYDDPEAEDQYTMFLQEQDEAYAEYMMDRLEDRYEDRYDCYE